MATLYDEINSVKIYLRSTHVFGRNPSKSDTILSDPDASQIHASIRWNGNTWEIVDHSRNGTLINGKRLAANTKVTLSVGQQIRFAPGANALWRVESLAPAANMLLPSHKDAPVLTLVDFHLLPNDTAPEASVYLSPQGQWICESSQASTFLQHGDTIRLGEHSWKFVGSPTIDATADIGPHQPSDTRRTRFDFTVSQNEEHTTLAIFHSQKQVTLGERVHHYSLLTLARRRLADAQRGIDAASQGWLEIEELSRMLGVDPAHLNIQIFRLRNQIAQTWPQDVHLTNVIERRRGEVRFGAYPFQIVRGSTVEGSFEPLPDAAANILPATANKRQELSG